MTHNEYGMKDEKQIIKYLPLVQSIVDKMVINYRQGMERDDYITLGVIGLIEALDKFDPSLNVSFEHYAKWRIKGAIYDELRRSGSISRNRMDKLNQMYKAKSNLQQELMREPTDQEICEHMEISIKDLHGIYETVHYLSYSFLEETLVVNHDEYTLMELIEDKEAISPQKKIEDEELKHLLNQSIQKLTEKEQIVLNLYYKEELPLKEIALILEVSISRVSQIHGKLLLKLKDIMTTNKE